MDHVFITLVIDDMVAGLGPHATSVFATEFGDHELAVSTAYARKCARELFYEPSSLLYDFKRLNADCANALIWLLNGIMGEADVEAGNLFYTRYALPLARAFNPTRVPPTHAMVRSMCRALDRIHMIQTAMHWDDIDYVLAVPDVVVPAGLDAVSYFGRSHDDGVVKTTTAAAGYAADQMRRYYTGWQDLLDKRQFAPSRCEWMQGVRLFFVLVHRNHNCDIMPTELVGIIMSFVRHDIEPVG
jgi:hypothetical protein